MGQEMDEERTERNDKNKKEKQKMETKEQMGEHQFLLNNKDEMTFDFMSWGAFFPRHPPDQ